MLVKSEIIGLLNEVMKQSAKMRKGDTQATYFCPFCNHHKRKLEVCLEEGPDFSKWHCWTCNERGAYLGSLLYKLQAPPHYRDAIAKLTGDIRLAYRPIPNNPTYVCLPPEFNPMHKPKNTPEYKNALAYLKRRGVTQEDILRYNIGYCEDGGEYDQHIIIPSYDAKGDLNFFIGRRYYIDDPGIPHKKPEASMDTIIGFECFINWNEPLNLVEGVFDGIAVRNNAVPLFGKYPSSALRIKMNEYHVRRVNVILDWDAEADAIKMYQRLHREVPMVEVHVVKLDGKDPSKLGFERTHTLIRNSSEFDETDLLKYKLEI